MTMSNDYIQVLTTEQIRNIEYMTTDKFLSDADVLNGGLCAFSNVVREDLSHLIMEVNIYEID
jgi:hypothetical protein